MYREEIAKKAKVSLASVKRAIKTLKDSGILSVYSNIHTKKGDLNLIDHVFRRLEGLIYGEFFPIFSK